MFEKMQLFGLAGEGCPDLARDAFGRPEIGPVAVRKLHLEAAGPGVMLLEFGLGEHQVLLERGKGKLFADEDIKVAFFNIYCWHG